MFQFLKGFQFRSGFVFFGWFELFLTRSNFLINQEAITRVDIGVLSFQMTKIRRSQVVAKDVFVGRRIWSIPRQLDVVTPRISQQTKCLRHSTARQTSSANTFFRILVLVRRSHRLTMSTCAGPGTAADFVTCTLMMPSATSMVSS